MTDLDRRRAERILVDDPHDQGAQLALVALDEREGHKVERLGPNARAELRRRAINEDDAVALALLHRDWAADYEVLVEAVPGAVPLVGAVRRVGVAERSSTRRVVVQRSPLTNTDHKAVRWDREVFGQGQDSPYREYFQNFASDAQGRAKSRGECSGPIGQGYLFMLHEVVALVDAGCDAAQAQHLWNNDGVASFRTGSHTLLEWPMRQIMFPPRGIPTREVDKVQMLFPLGGRGVATGDHPPILSDYDPHWFRIECPGLTALPVMLCLMGIRARDSL